eukprot:294416-Amorphochlora_amoeboformis.AAC.1
MPTITAMIPLAIFFGLAAAIDNGKGLTPPMGWRSWNLYGDNVSQDLLESIMDAMVVRKRLVNGVPTSLCDLGYCDVGLDDAWQECGSYGKVLTLIETPSKNVIMGYIYDDPHTLTRMKNVEKVDTASMPLLS